MADKNKKFTVKNIFSVLFMIFILIVSIICLKGMIESTNSFIDNQTSFNETYSNTANKIANLSNIDRETIEISLEYLDKLQLIQKSSATNDVMSFIYSALSTILVGLCAGFVAKSYKNIEIANKSANEASAKADEAKKSAESSKENSDLSQINLNDAKKDLEDAKNVYSDALKEIYTQKNAIEIITIHIEIVHARASLFAKDRIAANQRLYTIKRLVENLSINTDKNLVTQLLQELLSLKTAIAEYNSYIELLEELPIKTSSLQAIERYYNQLECAVAHCDKIISARKN